MLGVWLCISITGMWVDGAAPKYRSEACCQKLTYEARIWMWTNNSVHMETDVNIICSFEQTTLAIHQINLEFSI